MCTYISRVQGLIYQPILHNHVIRLSGFSDSSVQVFAEYFICEVSYFGKGNCFHLVENLKYVFVIKVKYVNTINNYKYVLRVYIHLFCFLLLCSWGAVCVLRPVKLFLQFSNDNNLSKFQISFFIICNKKIYKIFYAGECEWVLRGQQSCSVPSSFSWDTGVKKCLTINVFEHCHHVGKCATFTTLDLWCPMQNTSSLSYTWCLILLFFQVVVMVLESKGDTASHMMIKLLQSFWKTGPHHCGSDEQGQSLSVV